MVYKHTVDIDLGVLHRRLARKQTFPITHTNDMYTYTYKNTGKYICTIKWS